MKKTECVVFWFRRDIRLHDNHGFYKALNSGYAVIPLFIFDRHILDPLPQDDARVEFIHKALTDLKNKIRNYKSDIDIRYGFPETIWKELITEYKIKAVYTNNDYEPYAKKRDNEIEAFLKDKNIPFYRFKDHVLFEEKEIVKPDGNPYTIFTPYSRTWKKNLTPQEYTAYKSEDCLNSLFPFHTHNIPSLQSLGFQHSPLTPSIAYTIPSECIAHYDKTRDDLEHQKGTSKSGIYLRFGIISIRELLTEALQKNEIFVNELIWRDFYQMILSHFPHVTKGAFKKKYDHILWENNKEWFVRWCEGRTGYPLVDAGMRELNTTGFMHNRARMVTASFLCKHLLIHWQWGERYFAQKLLDFDLASNNGGWQWAAGTGCDAAPYFRVFNPEAQQKKFDPEKKYIHRWVEEYGTHKYPKPMVDHNQARIKAIETYKKSLFSFS